MQGILWVVAELLSYVYAVLKNAHDFGRFRDDWDRTWSPASFFISVFLGLVLIALLGYGAYVAWGAIKTFLAT